MDRELTEEYLQELHEMGMAASREAKRKREEEARRAEAMENGELYEEEDSNRPTIEGEVNVSKTGAGKSNVTLGPAPGDEDRLVGRYDTDENREHFEVMLSDRGVTDEDIVQIIEDRWEDDPEVLDTLLHNPSFALVKDYYIQMIRDIILITGNKENLKLPRVLFSLLDDGSIEDERYILNTIGQMRHDNRVCAENIAPVFGLDHEIGQEVVDLADDALSALFGEDAEWEIERPSDVQTKKPELEEVIKKSEEVSKRALEERLNAIGEERAEQSVEILNSTPEERRELMDFTRYIKNRQIQNVYARLTGLPYSLEEGSVEAYEQLKEMTRSEIEVIIDSPEGRAERQLLIEENRKAEVETEKIPEIKDEDGLVQKTREERHIENLREKGELDDLVKASEDAVPITKKKVENSSSNTKVYNASRNKPQPKPASRSVNNFGGGNTRSAKKQPYGSARQTAGRVSNVSLSEYFESEYYQELPIEEKRQALLARFTGTAQDMAYAYVPDWNADQEVVQEATERIEKFEANPIKRTIKKMKLLLKTRKFKITMKVGALMALNLATGVITKQVEFENIGQILTLLGISLSTFFLSRELAEEGISDGVMVF